MPATITPMPLKALPMDANGLPVGHHRALEAVTDTFMQWVNELPSSVYHLDHTDAKQLAGMLLRSYLVELERAR
jgi:hypothetical protein